MRTMLGARVRSASFSLSSAFGLLGVLLLGGASAQAPRAPDPAPVNVASLPVNVPGFWDPRRRPDRPDLTRINMIRFLTENDYPPFNYVGADGNPAGFNV